VSNAQTYKRYEIYILHLVTFNTIINNLAYTVSQKSDAKIQITITTVYLIRFKYPLKSFNRRHCGANVANFNKINHIVSVHRLIKQEAPPTLRGQRGRCRNIKGDLQIFGSFPSPRLCLLFLWVWFFGESWQTQVVHQI